MDIFNKIKYRFVKSFIDISHYLDIIIQSEINESTIIINELNENIKFKKIDNKISIDF